MKDNRVDHGVCYLLPNGNHGEKDKHRSEQRARKQLRSRGRSWEGVCGGEVVACRRSHRVHLCYWGQGRTLPSRTPKVSYAKLSQGEEESRMSLPPLFSPNACHLFQKPNPFGKDDSDLGRRRNFAASECKQLACLSWSKA